LGLINKTWFSANPGIQYTRKHSLLEKHGQVVKWGLHQHILYINKCTLVIKKLHTMLLFFIIVAKAKRDEMRHPKTGGGKKPPSATSAEHIYMEWVEGAPHMEGIAGGIETPSTSSGMCLCCSTQCWHDFVKLLKLLQCNFSLVVFTFSFSLYYSLSPIHIAILHEK
jgi:hypothetical protein